MKPITEQPLVSVIIPVYNVEEYIEKCVRSIMDQDYVNMEIILVDDGSPDASGEILERLAQIDDRIRVIHKENGGVSSARNSGLLLAQGKYVAFIDGDDYVEKDYISYLVELAEEFDCDVAISSQNYTSFNKKQILEDYRRLETAEWIIELIYLMTINVAVWNKLYNNQFLKSNQISFNENFWYGEGMLFNIECLQYTDNVAVGDRKIYNQVSNPNSAMRKFSLESNYCGIRSLEHQKRLWKKCNQGIENAWIYHYRCFSSSILNGLVEVGLVEENKEEYRKCIKNLRSNIIVPMRVKIPIKQKLYYIVAAFFPVLLAKRAKWKKKREKNRMKKSVDFQK